jgi:hypothetical protein
MRNLNNIEANAIFLLQELEKAIIGGYSLTSSVVLQMNALKKAIEEEDKMFGKDLEALYKQTINNVKN